MADLKFVISESELNSYKLWISHQHQYKFIDVYFFRFFFAFLDIFSSQSQTLSLSLFHFHINLTQFLMICVYEPIHGLCQCEILYFFTSTVDLFIYSSILRWLYFWMQNDLNLIKFNWVGVCMLIMCHFGWFFLFQLNCQMSHFN